MMLLLRYAATQGQADWAAELAFFFFSLITRLRHYAIFFFFQ